MVFDPYEKKTILHRFLPLFMMMPFIGAMVLGVMLLLLISSGLLLALLVVVVSLGLMTVGESFEAYTESKLLIRAMKNGDRLGMGDLRLLEDDSSSFGLLLCCVGGFPVCVGGGFSVCVGGRFALLYDVVWFCYSGGFDRWTGRLDGEFGSLCFDHSWVTGSCYFGEESSVWVSFGVFGCQAA
jgi:hypothetical protein